MKQTISLVGGALARLGFASETRRRPGDFLASFSSNFGHCARANGEQRRVHRAAPPNPSFEATSTSGPPHAGKAGFAHSALPARVVPLLAAPQFER